MKCEDSKILRDKRRQEKYRNEGIKQESQLLY